MCGIVGVASPGPMQPQMKDFFQSMLLHDVIRGHHATGIAAIDTYDRSLAVEKRALPSYDFLRIEDVQKNLFDSKHNFNIYIGHNRWATMGDKSKDDNAHPFVHGDIVGVHNGSLRGQHRLDDSSKFEVDSDNLYYHMDKNGLDQSLTKIDGAFSLVWYDRSDNTLNFIRNSERPMVIAKLTNGSYVWCSEMGMMRWLVGRHRTLKFDTVKQDGYDIQACWNIEEGAHIKFEFADKSRAIPKMEVVEKTLPSFPDYTSRYMGGSGSQSGWSNGGSSGTSSVSSGGSGVTSVRSAHVVAQDKVIQQFIPTGNSSSFLEVKFVERIEYESDTRYRSNVSLFEYIDRDGESHLFHIYNHTNSPTIQWGESDKGREVYAQVGMIQEQAKYHPDFLVDQSSKMVMSLCNLTTHKPTGTPYFSCWTPEAIAKRKAALDAQEKKNQAGTQEKPKVVPLDAARLMRDNQHAIMVQLANMEYPGARMKAIFEENSHCCANCGKRFGNSKLATIYLHQHADEESASLYNYLSCSARCNDEMESFTKEIDRAWEMKKGASNLVE